MSINIENIHATALSKITDFVNFEHFVLHNTKSKFKLSHAQALEYIARIRGFNTRKGSENKESPLDPSEVKNQFKPVFERQFGNGLELDRLFACHTAYLESQQWDLTNIADPDTALAFGYINNAKWNAVAKLYLESQPDDWNDGKDKPQLLISHLFTANALSHMTEKSDDGYELNDLSFIEISKPIPAELTQAVTSSYKALSASCFDLISLDMVVVTRLVDYLMANVNGEFNENCNVLNTSTAKKPDLKNKHYNANLILKDISIDHIRKTSARTNFVFNIPHNIPNLEFGGDTFELMLGQLKNLNSTIREQDYISLSLRQEGVSLNAWNYYLINYYNAVLDFSPIIFRQLAHNERFVFDNVYFDDFGRVFYKTENPIKVSFLGKEYLLSENDFSILFSFMITKQVVTERNTPFNLYMSFYHQLMIHKALSLNYGMDNFEVFKNIKLA